MKTDARQPVRRRSRRWRLRPGRLAVFIILAGVAVTTVYPFLFVTKMALKSEQEYILDRYGWPRSPSLANFAGVWVNSRLARHIANSLMWRSITGEDPLQ